MSETVKQTNLSSLLEEYGIVAGELSTDGLHLEPIRFIQTLLQDDNYPIEVVRAFLNHYYLPDVTEAFLSEFYGEGVQFLKQATITALDGRKMRVYVKENYNESESDYFEYIENEMERE